jgi:hypothetical protein
MSGESIFLSYANEDRSRVELLIKTLEGQGLDVWWDRDIPRGKNFNRVIEEALQKAHCAIVVWSTASVTSEWVFNEASAARKRGILVPVLIDDVDPPLEFRHLQAARLVDWRGDTNDAEWIGLLDAVRSLVLQPGSTPAGRAASTPEPVQRGHWWRTPAGIAVGAGVFLAGVAVLVIALRQVGLLGGAAPDAPNAALPAVAPSAGVQSPVATPPDTVRPAAAPPEGSAEVKAASAVARTNLLDPEEGGTLVIASEDSWRKVMERRLQSTIIASQGFAVFAFRNEKPATIDAVGVYVESSDMHNLKEMAVYAADQSETGPFRKIAVLTVPNYRNMRAPFHEFKVEPFTARYVKLELISWQADGGLPNGYVGNMQLLGTLR